MSVFSVLSNVTAVLIPQGFHVGRVPFNFGEMDHFKVTVDRVATHRGLVNFKQQVGFDGGLVLKYNDSQWGVPLASLCSLHSLVKDVVAIINAMENDGVKVLPVVANTGCLATGDNHIHSPVAETCVDLVTLGFTG